MSGRLTELISSYLGVFFQEVEKEHLQIGLWQGNLTLKNLKLRPDTLEQLWPNVSLSIHGGHVGYLHLKIPWGRLTTGKARLVIHDLELCLQPRVVSGSVPKEVVEAMESAEQIIKQQIVQRAEEELFSSKGVNRPKKSWGAAIFSSIATSVLLKVLHNLEVEIKNINIAAHSETEVQSSLDSDAHIIETASILHQDTCHISVEQGKDEGNSIQGGHMIGIHIERVFVGGVKAEHLSQGPSFKSHFSAQDGGKQIFSKSMSIEDIGLYVHGESFQESSGCLTSNRECYHRHVPKPEAASWLILPTTIEASFRASTEHPQHGMVQDISIEVSKQINVAVNQEHYASIASLWGEIGAAGVRLRSWRRRPEQGIIENPKAWWIYAKEAILLELRLKNGGNRSCSPGSWKKLIERTKLRNQYVDCYLILLMGIDNGGTIPETASSTSGRPSDLVQHLNHLEHQLSAEEIILFRGVARIKTRIAGMERSKVQGVVNAVYSWFSSRPRDQPSSASSSARSSPRSVADHPNSVLTTESTYEDVAAVLFQEWSCLKSKKEANCECGDRDIFFKGELDDSVNDSYLHMNLIIRDFEFTLLQLSSPPALARQAVILAFDVTSIRGELWTAMPGHEMGLNLSIDDIIGRGMHEEIIMTFEGSTGDIVDGQAALLLHVDVCPKGRSPDLVDELNITESDVDAYLKRTQRLKHKQMAIELVAAPLKLDLKPWTIDAVLSFVRIHGMQDHLQSPQDSSRLRYLAACRQASQSSPSHIKFIVSQHETTSFALSVKAIQITVKSLDNESEEGEVVVQLEDIRAFRGAYLKAFLMADSSRSAPVSKVFTLSHDIGSPRTYAQSVLQSCQSSCIERTYASVSSVVAYVTKQDKLNNGQGHVVCYPLLAQPVNLELIASSCIVLGHTGYPRVGFDVIISPIDVCVSQTRLNILMRVNETLSSISRKYSQFKATPKKNHPPRLILLADLVHLHVEATVQKMTLAIHGEDEQECDDDIRPPPSVHVITEIARAWMHYSEPGQPSEILRKLALSRIVQSGFSKDFADLALDYLAREFNGARGLPWADTEMHLRANQSVAVAFADKSAADICSRIKYHLVAAKWPTGMYRPLIKLCLAGLTLSYVQLTYDTRLAIGMDDCHVEDRNALNLLHLKLAPSSSTSPSVKALLYEEEKAVSPKRPANRSHPVSAKRPQVERDASAINAQAVENEAASMATTQAEGKALVITMVNQDHEYSWGRGGEAVNSIGRASVLRVQGKPPRHRDRDSHTSIRINVIDVLLKVDVLTEQLDSLAKVLHDLSLLCDKSNVRVTESETSGLDFQRDPSGDVLPVLERTIDFRCVSSAITFIDDGKAFFRLAMDEIACQSTVRLQGGSSLSYVCDGLLLEDLTPGGEDYPIVITKSPGTFLRESIIPILAVRYGSNGRQESSVNVASTLLIQTQEAHICFTNRILRIYLERSPGISSLIRTVISFPATAHTTAPDASAGPGTIWSIDCTNSTIVLPKNSGETDLVAFKVASLYVTGSPSKTTWKTPGNENEASHDVFESTAKDSVDGPPSSSSSYATSKITVPHESDEEEFYDAQSEAESNIDSLSQGGSGSSPRSTAAHENAQCSLPFVEHAVGLSRGATLPMHLCTPVQGCQRLAVRAHTVDIFAAVLNKNTNIAGFSEQHRQWGAVVHGNSVYQDRFNNEGCNQQEDSTYIWEKLSRAPTNFDFFWDTINGTKGRYLLRFDPPSSNSRSSFDCRMSMTQLYLLMSVWYDNISEDGHYYASNDPFVREENDQGASGGDAFPDMWPPYDTSSFFQRLFDLKMSWEFGLIAPSFILSTTFDRDSLLSQPPSFFMADNGLNERKLDVAQVTLTNAVLHVCGGESAVRLAFGAERVEVFDTRKPARTLEPAFFRCGLQSSVQEENPGFADSTFGFTSDLEPVSSNLPLQLTLSMTPDDWMCINVGVKDAEGIHKDLSLVWLLIDIYSLYFRFSCYGKPGLVDAPPCPTNTKGNARRNYDGSRSASVDNGNEGGIDVRVWVNKAALCVPEDALAKDSNTLVVQGGSNLFYRYRSSPLGSTLMHFRGDSMSLGLGVGGLEGFTMVKTLLREGHQGSNITDSRIIVDGLSTEFFYCFDKASNNLEVRAVLPKIDSSQSGVASSCEKNLSTRSLDDPFVIPTPAAVHPLETPSRTMAIIGSPRPCFIMGSHLDAAFVMGAILTFLGPDVDAVIGLKTELQRMARRGLKGSDGRTKDARKVYKASFASLYRRRSVEEPISEAVSETEAGVPLSALPRSSEGANPLNEIDNEEIELPPLTCQVTLEVSALKILLIDPTLGLHLPLIKLAIGDLHTMICQGPEGDWSSAAGADVLRLGRRRSDEIAGSLAITASGNDVVSNALHVSIHMRVWSDYFNVALKCWEPLLEPFSCRVLYEDGLSRGRGLTLRAYCPLLLNVTSAFLQTLGYTSRLVSCIEANIFHIEQLCSLLYTTVHDPQLESLLFESDAGLRSVKVEQNSHFEVEEIEIEKKALYSSPGRGLKRFTVYHEVPKPLAAEARTPFSISNLTGQRLRCYQSQGSLQSATLQYLGHGEKAVLAFGATLTVLRDLKPSEVPFDVNNDVFLPSDEAGPISQMGNFPSQEYTLRTRKGAATSSDNSRGWNVSIQVAGYRWLTCISADTLGVKFETLRPLPGMIDIERILNNWKISNALKLVSEVRLLNGCRQLTIRSLFRVRNCTKHDLILVAQASPVDTPPPVNLQENTRGGWKHSSKSNPSAQTYTTLSPGATFNVSLPLLRLATSWSGTATANLGRFWIRPKYWHPQKFADERMARRDEVQFSTESIDLTAIVEESARLFEHQHGHDNQNRDMPFNRYNLLCPVTQRVNQNASSGPPPVSYCVEVVRTGLKPAPDGGGHGGTLENDLLSKDQDQGNVTELLSPPSMTNTQVGCSHSSTGVSSKRGVRAGVKKAEIAHQPLEYTILIHPPLVLENLLPEACIFELHDSKAKTLLWKSHFQAGQSLPVHDVRLDYPLLLSIQTEYSRSPEGALIHKGDALTPGDHDIAKSIVLIDAENQKLLLELHHQVGGAGQRRITVACPYWLINNTNCMLTYLQEGKSTPPAGTVLSMKDGHGDGDETYERTSKNRRQPSFASLNVSGWCKKRHKQFPGDEGLQQFHRKVKGGLRINTTRMSTRFTECYDLGELCEASFMFNFGEDTLLTLSQRRLKVKVNDSVWSKGFSLDTVGVNQVLTVRHPQWGDMEIGFIINLAPGRLGQYTKVVFFCPRYIVWNRHPLSLFLAQDSTYFRLGHISDEVQPQTIAQAHLPRSSEKRVTVQLKGGYDKSTAFDIDEGLDLCLKLCRQTDLSKVKHLMTRKAPEFDLSFPPTQEIGLWVETDWNHENLVVKAIKAKRWAEDSEIQKGDVLLAINGRSVTGRDFKQVMGELKGLLAGEGAIVRFRTHEEHMRLLRLRALGQIPIERSHQQAESDKEGPEYITVQLKPVGPSVYVIVGQLDSSVSPPYRIVNKTKNFIVHFRQLGCESHPWSSLAPHESAIYAWDEPMKPHRLDVRVGIKKVATHDPYRRGLIRRRVPYEFSSKHSSVRVRLDEIGYVHLIPLQDVYTDDGQNLVARVEAEGVTRTLYISKDGSLEESGSIERREEELIKLKQIYLQHRNIYHQLREEIYSRGIGDAAQVPRTLNLAAVETAVLSLEDQLGATDPHIRQRNQLLIEVKEAKGLRSADLSGLSDPYVQLSLKVHDRSSKRDQTYRQRFTTYVVEKTLNPKWQNQLFIFRVPAEAHDNPKSYSIKIKVMDFDGPVKKSDFLGQIDMQLDVLENELELDGWYFLTPRQQQFQQAPQASSNQPGLGAIHLRMQWVHSLTGLVSHLAQWSDEKLGEIECQEIQIEKDKIEQMQRLQQNALQNGILENRRSIPREKRGDPNREFRRSVTTMDNRKQNEGHLGDSIGSVVQRGEEVLQVDYHNSITDSTSSAAMSITQSFDDGSRSSLRARKALSRWRRRQQLQQQHSAETASPSELHGTTALVSGPNNNAHRTSVNVSFAADVAGGIAGLMRSRSQRLAPYLSKRSMSQSSSARSTRLMIAAQHTQARKSFVQEVARSHRCVNNSGGILTIRPLQALNLVERSKPIYATVRYGLQVQKTAKARPGVYPRWESSINRNQLTVQVEHLDTTGTIHINVWSEHELQDTELGRLELSLGSVVDCCGEHGDYVRWFPLLRPLASQSGDEDGSTMYPWTSEKTRSEDFANEPCMKLSFRWSPLDKGPKIPSDMYLRAYLREVSIAIIDSYQRVELLSLTIRGIESRYVDNRAITRASLVVSCVQIDNQLPKCDAPIILGPTPVQVPQPLLHCSLFREKDKNQLTRTEHLYSLKYVFVLLQELDVKLEEDFIGSLWHSLARVLVDYMAAAYNQSQGDEANGIESRATSGTQERRLLPPMAERSQHEEIFLGVNSPSRAGVKNDVAFTEDEEEKESAENALTYAMSMVYVEQLELCPIKVNISFYKSTSEKKTWRSSSFNWLAGADTSHVLVNNQLTSTAGRRNPRLASIFTSLQLLIDVVLPLIPTISDASIKLNALDISHVFQTPDQIVATLQAHYTSNFLFQVYKILGSVDIIGNPLSFASSLGTGVIDFFYEPAQGLIKSPKAFVRGVVKGTSSLVSNTTAGFLSVAGRISKSMGHGVLTLSSKDQRYLKSRERLAKEKKDIYIRPAKDFFHGIFHGVTGVVADPYHGAKEDGCKGFVIGLGYGIIGIVAKPVVGVLDAIAHASEGFKDLAMVISLEKRLEPVRRHRLQHTFAVDGRLVPYDVKLARGLMVLQQFEHKSPRKKLLAGIGAPPSRSEVGGAMAAVEAAGRTVFISTKQVVSAMAGTLNIVEAREESVETWGADLDDCIIMTEIIRREKAEETLLVISTKRVLCVEYSDRSGSAPELELLWQVPLKAIRNIELKYMPLVLTLEIDPSATKHSGIGTGLPGGGTGMLLASTSAVGDEKDSRGGSSLRREGSSVTREERFIHKRVFGDWQHDKPPFTRICNLVKCLLGRVEEINVDMDYEYQGPFRESRGFRFGMWEFSTRNTMGAEYNRDKYSGRRSTLPNTISESDADMTGHYVYGILENLRWAGTAAEDETDPIMQEVFATQKHKRDVVSDIKSKGASSTIPFSSKPRASRGNGKERGGGALEGIAEHYQEEEGQEPKDIKAHADHQSRTPKTSKSRQKEYRGPFAPSFSNIEDTPNETMTPTEHLTGSSNGVRMLKSLPSWVTDTKRLGGGSQKRTLISPSSPSSSPAIGESSTNESILQLLKKIERLEERLAEVEQGGGGGDSRFKSP